MARHLFTSESVSMGHPDKVADQVSDAILDALLAQDPNSRVACETMVTTGLAVVAGEITTEAVVNYQDIIRATINRIGYTSDAYGINGDTCAVMVSLDKQSPDISQGVSEGEGLHAEQGAGDQGLMFGFACNETDVLMPFPVHYSHRLVEKMAELRQSGELPWLRPTGAVEADLALLLEQLWSTLDEQSARLAARRATHEQREHFRTIAERFHVVTAASLADDDSGRHGYYTLVTEFYAAIDAALGRSPHLATALGRVRTHLARVRRLAHDDDARLVASASEHGAIADAIADGDAERAAHATHLHLHNALTSIHEHLALRQKETP